MKHLPLVAPLLFSLTTLAQLPKGDRTLAWQIDVAENGSFDSAVVHTQAACIEAAHFLMTWSSLEPDTGQFDPATIYGFLDVLNIYFSAINTPVELQIAPINTVAREVPSELQNVPFNDPLMIDHFKRMLDTVFAYISDIQLIALNIANEHDVYFGVDAAQYNEFKTFLDSVIPHAKQLYFNLHGTDLKMGTTFTHGSLVHPVLGPLCQTVNAGLDIVSTTYYPLHNDFTMEPPASVATDFADLVSMYPDTAQPIYFVECGYSSSTTCNSSEWQQAQFYSEMFNAWDAHYNNIKYVTIFKSTDWSQAEVDTLAVYYNINDPIFKEYLRTLGVRTWPGNGANKLAYDRIRCELDARGWCATNCITTAVEPVTQEQDMFHVFPSPASNRLTITGPIQDTRIELLDLTGQVLMVGTPIRQQVAIDVSTLPDGLYFIRHSDDDGINTRRVVVAR